MLNQVICTTDDEETLFYSCSALGNLLQDNAHREKLLECEHQSIIVRIIELVWSLSDSVRMINYD